MKVLLSGNEAIARGAYESGVSVATAYPGTPSTEILENIVKYESIHAQWSPNEKVAMEVGIGAAIAGKRALVTMKHVGVNVAADPLFTASYTGVRGGLVIITADDPAMHSSQNEQDNRNYARFAKIPMLEPSDSQEAKDFVKLAFEISEEYDTPVFLRSLTRISHSKSIVSLSEPEVRDTQEPAKLEKDPQKLVMLPANARTRHPLVEERIKRLSEFADDFEKNEISIQNTSIGIISGGISYMYAKESFPDYSFLKLSMTYPLPEKKIREFARQVDTVYVVEELDPFIEDQIRVMGIDVKGKSVFPICGEFSPTIVQQGIKGTIEKTKQKPLIEYLPPRPPNMCPGCPHRGIFHTLKKLKVFVSGDIGCYTLAALPPLKALDSCICMGASIGVAMGIDKALGPEGTGKAVAVIGDSTFLHSGITGLLDIVYNKGNCTVILLDNRTTAMTGRQEHPGTGYTIKGEETKSVDYPTLCKALGVDHIKIVNPFNLKQLKTVLKEEINRPAPSVVIAQEPCVLHRRDRKTGQPTFTVKKDECDGCKSCLQLGCPAIEWQPEEEKGRAYISQALCSGCSLCVQVCPTKSIVREKNRNE